MTFMFVLFYFALYSFTYVDIRRICYNSREILFKMILFLLFFFLFLFLVKHSQVIYVCMYTVNFKNQHIFKENNLNLSNILIATKFRNLWQKHKALDSMLYFLMPWSPLVFVWRCRLELIYMAAQVIRHYTFLCRNEWIISSKLYTYVMKAYDMRAGVLCPKCDNFACLHTRQDQNELYLKR